MNTDQNEVNLPLSEHYVPPCGYLVNLNEGTDKEPEWKWVEYQNGKTKMVGGGYSHIAMYAGERMCLLDKFREDTARIDFLQKNHTTVYRAVEDVRKPLTSGFHHSEIVQEFLGWSVDSLDTVHVDIRTAIDQARGVPYDKATSRLELLEELVANIRASVALDRCDGGSELAEGINTACAKHLKTIDELIARSGLTIQMVQE